MPCAVSPTRGGLLLFEHDLFHEGEGVKGRKEILRTDVQYQVKVEFGTLDGPRGVEDGSSEDEVIVTAKDVCERCGVKWGEVRDDVPESLEAFRTPGRDVMFAILKERVGNERAWKLVDEVFKI